MEIIVLGFISLIFYFAVRALSKGASWFSNTRYKGYRQLAKAYRGRYEYRGMSDPPTVSFRFNDSTIRVGLAPHVPGQPIVPRTRVVARFAHGIPLRLELAPELRPAPPQAPKGTRHVRTGQVKFDREFVVQANDPDMAAAFLAEPIQLAVSRLTRMAPPGGMLISINPERLLVQVDRNLAPFPDALQVMVREALLILNGLLIGVASRSSAGVTILDESPGIADLSTDAPVCKVCGESITGRKVLCALCKTPHHDDCWEYIGACSVFGCTSKQATIG